MRRIQIPDEQYEVLTGSETTQMMMSLEGAQCRMYLTDIPLDTAAGHLISDGYQIVIPAGVSVTLMKVGAGSAAVVVGPFGVTS